MKLQKYLVIIGILFSQTGVVLATDTEHPTSSNIHTENDYRKDDNDPNLYNWDVNNHPNTGRVVINYMDENYDKIAATEVQTGKFGEIYLTNKKKIKGYIFDKVKGKTSGKIAHQEITITYVYHQREKQVVSQSHINYPIIGVIVAPLFLISGIVMWRRK